MTRETLYRAGFVLPVTSPPIRDAFVSVRDGVVTGVGRSSERPRGGGEIEIDLGSTLLLPGFVNAHTHLELSNLAGAVPADRGFVTWIEDQMRVRAERGPDDVPTAVRGAIATIQAQGTAAVADVSNSLAAVGPLAESGLHALVLHEILGFDPSKASLIFEQTKAARAAAAARLRPAVDEASSTPPVAARVRIETAAHAPHSLSPQLFALLMSDSGIRSIHVAESRAEDDFLRHGGGVWREFLDRRVGPIPFDPPRTTPVRYLDSLGVLRPRTLAVHCVRVDEDDAKILAARGAVAVLCPRSNEYLGNGVPPLAMLLGNRVAIAFGTDSLASCASLDVLEDARFLARKFPRVPAAALLHALTRGGALALGFEGLGEIRIGAMAKFAAVPFQGAPPADAVAYVLNEAAPPRGVA